MGNTYTNLLYHVVFSTKERRPLINAALAAELYKYIGGIVRGEGGKLLEIGGVADHVHLVVKSKADLSLADLLRIIKANSSKWANEQSPGKPRRFSWQTGYAAFSVSESQLTAVRAYVRGQEQHHRKLTFREELVMLLQKHGIEYDERYLLD